MVKSRIDSQENIDQVLLRLVALVEKTTISLGITINVGGCLITGNLIGGNSYFKGLAKQMRSEHQSIEDGMSSFLEMLGYSYVFSDEEAAEPKSIDPLYIHMQEVIVIASGGTPIHNPYWRGKLKSVDGFMLGKYTN